MKILNANENPVIGISDLLVIAPNSNPTLSNAKIGSNLHINDDSSLTIDSNTQFSENSIIKFTINGTEQVDENMKPIIYSKDSLNSIPSEIILSLLESDNVEIQNMPLIGSESFDSCNNLSLKVTIENNKDISYSTSCKKQGQIVSLYLNIPADDDNNQSNDGKKKGNVGLIVGVVIGVVAVIAIIVVVVVIVIKRKRSLNSSDVNLVV